MYDPYVESGFAEYIDELAVGRTRKSLCPDSREGVMRRIIRVRMMGKQTFDWPRDVGSLWRDCEATADGAGRAELFPLANRRLSTIPRPLCTAGLFKVQYLASLPALAILPGFSALCRPEKHVVKDADPGRLKH